MRLGVALALALGMVAGAAATGSPAPVPPARSAPPSPEPPAMRHGAQPNPQEVRPGSPEGDAPSATVGTLSREPQERRILGLPVSAVLVIAGVLVAVLALAGIAVPRARRRHRPRGGGTYGR